MRRDKEQRMSKIFLMLTIASGLMLVGLGISRADDAKKEDKAVPPVLAWGEMPGDEALGPKSA